MEELATDAWKPIDEFIITDCWLQAVKAYRELTGAGINTAMEVIAMREQSLRASQPQCFRTEAAYRAEAFQRLQNIASEARIVAIEGSWDGDSRGHLIHLSAITEQPSPQHPKYSEQGLYVVQELELIERAKAFGTELANAAGVDFHLTFQNTEGVNYEQRWWDSPKAREEN